MGYGLKSNEWLYYDDIDINTYQYQYVNTGAFHMDELVMSKYRLEGCIE